MIPWIALLLVLLGVASVPWLAERRRYPSEAFRANGPGKFAKLSQGVTHYRWLGVAQGPVVVCVHGLSTPSPVWYAIAEGLGGLGFRVLVYDLYGRGFSDAPDGAQTGDFFARQLSDLLDDQDIKRDITLLGFSMGGSICTHFAAKYPSRVRRLVLLASGGMWLRETRLTRIYRTWPIIGDWLHATIGVRNDRRALRKQLGTPCDVPGLVEVQLGEYQTRGFVRSMLSSRRHMLAETQKVTHQKIAKARIPVAAIWAENDDVIPLKSLGTLTQWNGEVRQEIVPEAGHAICYTHASEVVSLLRDILTQS